MTVQQVGDFHIGPLPSQVRPLERVSGFRLQPGSDTYYAGQAADLRVFSDTYFWVDVESQSANDAITEVETNRLPQLQVAMSLRIDSVPYMVEVLWATDGRENKGNWSAAASTAFWHPEALSKQYLDGIRRDHEAILADRTAQQAARFLASAIRQQAISDGSWRLTYFKVIELIANHVGPVDPPEREAQEAAILLKLQQALRSKRSTRSKISAVRDAETKLARLAGQFLSIRVEATAEELELSPEWRADAIRFVKLRNQLLSHASTSDHPRFDFDPSRPRELVRGILEAYVDRR